MSRATAINKNLEILEKSIIYLESTVGMYQISHRLSIKDELFQYTFSILY